MAAANLTSINRQTSVITPIGYPADTNNSQTAGAATPVIITFAAVPGNAHRMEFLVGGYIGGTPTGGLITIVDSILGTIFQTPIADAGFFVIPLCGLTGQIGASIVITLASGAGAVVGSLNVMGHKLECQ